METKTVNSYQVGLAEFEQILNNNDVILEKIGELLKDRWVFMENKEVFYDNEVVALYPDLNHYETEHIRGRDQKINDHKIIKELKKDFSDLYWDFPTKKEVKKTFKKVKNYPFRFHNDYYIYYNKDKDYNRSIVYKDSEIKYYSISSDSLDAFNDGIVIPICRLNGKDSNKLETGQVLLLWLEHSLIPQGLNEEEKETYKLLIDCIKVGANNFNEDKSKKLSESLKNSKLKIKNETIKEKLLNTDQRRANIESYDSKMLSDPNRGHWSLWEHGQYQNPVELQFDGEFVARNPKADLKEGGVVGIDFGTKSTVVVHQENSTHSLPMRVGMGEFSKEVEAKHYENPTVMEFKDLNSFLSDYRAKVSRPHTSWNDLTVSHTAFNSLMNSESKDYYSVLIGLKQWAGDKQRKLRLRDQQGEEQTLAAFLELEENDLNPIELYAYYIGLYINNQHNGIYLNYILSFPVSYEKEVREKLLESFSLGLKKSLPLALYDEQEAMDKFEVLSGASEPAAYAICALQEYAFEPFENEEVFYGIFDFGGGTTDFDFGIWRGAALRDRRHDFVIEHFGSEGYEYLGGENLLELLAFEVFKANKGKLREKDISFTLAPKCKKFPGHEVLLNNSQEAKLNMKKLMKKLRNFWERPEGYQDEYSKGMINVSLFDKSGKEHPKVELDMDQEFLEEKLRGRIEEGVLNFFDALRRAFKKPMTDNVEKINIFLAGNSSKSEIVQELFQEYIAKEVEGILQEKNGGEVDVEDLYQVFPPLGTEEAYAIQEEKGLEVDRDNIERPTGKTGVAFGLVDARKGGRIKVINKNVKDKEAKFKYFLGMANRGRFVVLVDRDTQYQKWHDFIDAGLEDFELYYTSVPEASRNKLDISEVKRKKCKIDVVDEDAFVYLRAVKPNVIEYVVATEQGIEDGEYLGEIVELEL